MRKADINLGKGKDLTDHLASGSEMPEDLVKNGKKDEVNVISGMQIFNTPYQKVEWAIKDMIPMRKKTVAVGDFEAGKSYLYLGAALSLASGKPYYLGFEIPKARKVLYIDLENGQDETLRRIQKLTEGHSFDQEVCAENFRLVTKPGDFSEVFPLIEAQVIMQEPDVVIIDNLYQLSGANNISDAEKIKPLLGQIEGLRVASDSAIVLIHHFLKNTQEQGLTEERMAGSSVLNWWMEYCTMLGKTNQSFSLFRVGKSRMGDKNPGIYVIEFNDQVSGGIQIESPGVVAADKVRGLVIPEPKKLKWQSSLDRMANEFTTTEWLNVTGDNMGESVAAVTAHRWLKEMSQIGMVKRVFHGKYKKTSVKFIETDS